MDMMGMYIPYYATIQLQQLSKMEMDIILSAVQLFREFLPKGVAYKGGVKHSSSKTFRAKSCHNDAKNTSGLQGKKMSRKH